MPHDPYVDKLAEDGERLRQDSQRLRDVSRRLLAEMDTIRQLERQSRRVPIGSDEFKRLSAEVEVRSRDVFRMSAEQNELAQGAEPQDHTLDELDKADD